MSVPRDIAGLFRDVDLRPLNMGLYGEGRGYVTHLESTEDVHFDHLVRWSEGRNLFSRLSWADNLRNVRLANELQRLEPAVVLEVGCGSVAPMAKLISGMYLDTLYIGMDVNTEFAIAPTRYQGRRPYVGIACDADLGLPMISGSVDVLLCLEALEHFALNEMMLESFFHEASRVLKDHGGMTLATPVPDGPLLMHPHCHTVEWSQAKILAAAQQAGFVLQRSWNYRVRPNVSASLGLRYGSDNPAMVDAFELPRLTAGKPLLPGNAVYVFDRA